MYVVSVTTNFDGLAIKCIARATQIGIEVLGYRGVNNPGSMMGRENNVDVIFNEG